MKLFRWRKRKTDKLYFITDAELECFSMSSLFEPDEVARLAQLFISLLPSEFNKRLLLQSGRVPKSVMVTLPCLAANPFRYRLCEVFSTAGEGAIAWPEFLIMFSLLRPSAPIPLRQSLLFQLYDCDGDGVIGREDVNAVLRMLTRDSVTQDDCEVICAAAVNELDWTGDGTIGEDELNALLDKTHYVSQFAVDILAN